MARLSLLDYPKSILYAITQSVYLEPKTVSRVIFLGAYGKSSDPKSKWKDYAAPRASSTSNKNLPEGQNALKKDYIGLRLLNPLHIPFLVVFGIRTALMKAIDRLVINREINKTAPGMTHESRGMFPPKASGWLAGAAKLFIAILTLPFEIPFYLLSKASDVTSDGLEKIIKKDKSKGKPYSIEMGSVRNIEKGLSTPTHAARTQVRQDKTPASVRMNPLFPAALHKEAEPSSVTFHADPAMDAQGAEVSNVVNLFPHKTPQAANEPFTDKGTLSQVPNLDLQDSEHEDMHEDDSESEGSKGHPHP